MTQHRYSDARTSCKRHPLSQLMLALYGLGLPSAGLLMMGDTHAQTASAAAASPDAVQEIVVTARKRNETLIEVPVSIQSLSEKDLRAAAITDIADLTTKSGFSFTSAQGNGAQGRASQVRQNLSRKAFVHATSHGSSCRQINDLPPRSASAVLYECSGTFAIICRSSCQAAPPR